MFKMKKIIIIGSGLGGLATAIRLSHEGYDVTILEKHSTPGGRLNIIEENGFRFDMGPTFMSMTYELEELFNYVGIKNKIELEELDPLYQVFFEGSNKPRMIWKNLEKLEAEFQDVETNLKEKTEKYLSKAAEFFHDTENEVIRSNFNNKIDYLLKLSRVPKKHLPYLFKTMWGEVEKQFDSNEVRIIFSLVAFFLGATPFQTPAIYSLLNYTEMKHNGYWKIKGGMYKLVEVLVERLESKGVKIIYDTEVVGITNCNGRLHEIVDQQGNRWTADIFVSNSDAASFRGKVLNRKKYSEDKLDNMHWTLAPFTVYLGVKGNIPGLIHHNYFLGNNFKGYADKIFTTSVTPQKPYYYVNVPTKSEKSYAPEGYEGLYILCPVPDLRFKKNWEDRKDFANSIINDLSSRINFAINKNLVVKKILAPDDWAGMFNLYRGSGLGLAHDINQVGAFRPANKDEVFPNLYYVGASTTPGTGLPMVIISSKLVTERIKNDYAAIS
jgi:phytoene desaturase